MIWLQWRPLTALGTPQTAPLRLLFQAPAMTSCAHKHGRDLWWALTQFLLFFFATVSRLFAVSKGLTVGQANPPVPDTNGPGCRGPACWLSCMLVIQHANSPKERNNSIDNTWDLCCIIYDNIIKQEPENLAWVYWPDAQWTPSCLVKASARLPAAVIGYSTLKKQQGGHCRLATGTWLCRRRL